MTGAPPLPLVRASGIFPGIMTAIADIGTRVELVPMDGNFHDITVALYRQSTAAGPAFRVHSYSTLDGSERRLDDVRALMTTLGGLQPSVEESRLLAFPCGEEHGLAVRRLFLEACKIGSPDDAAPPPLSTVDRKSGLNIVAEPLGDGQYRVEAVGEAGDADRSRRVGVIVNGLMKLGEMRRVEGAEDCVGFDCGHPHDELVGLLLVRAPNVRAIVREQEALAARGVLAAPSQQGGES